MLPYSRRRMRSTTVHSVVLATSLLTALGGTLLNSLIETLIRNVSKQVFSRALLVPLALCVGFSSVAVSALCSFTRSRQSDRKPRVISGTTLATSENVEGATLSPDGSTIALATSKLTPSAAPDEGDEDSFVEIWDIEKAKCIAKLKLSSVHYSLQGGVPKPERRVGERFIRYASGGKLLVVYDGEDLRVLQLSPATAHSNTDEAGSVQLRATQTIHLALGLPEGNTLVHSMEVTRDGSRAALGICNPREGSALMILVYNLSSSTVLWQWKFETGCVFSGYNPLSWDPQGARLAVSLPAHSGGSPHPFSFLGNKNHVYILDVNSGNTLQDIRAGYTAGPICFSSNNTVLTASLNADSRYFREDTIREWNVDTGGLVREIAGPPQGVHSLLALSADGNVILGYTGREKPVEHFLENQYLEFGIWDYRTGKSVATSGAVERPQPSNGLGDQTGSHASFGSGNARMVLAGAGNKVLLWWHQSSGPFLIYDVPPAQ
jgi:WD40 repeat protein